MEVYISCSSHFKRVCKRLWIFTAQIESKSWLQFLAQCKYISIKIALKACRYKVFITDNLTIYQIRRRKLSLVRSNVAIVLIGLRYDCLVMNWKNEYICLLIILEVNIFAPGIRLVMELAMVALAATNSTPT